MATVSYCLGAACSFSLHTFGLRPLKRKIAFLSLSKIYFPNRVSILVHFYFFTLPSVKFTLQWETGEC